MSIKSNLLKSAGLAIVVTGLGAGAAFAAVATSSVNVRTGPSTHYGVVDTLRPGEAVSVSRQSNGWCEISHFGPDGWVSCRYLSGSALDNRYTRYDRYHRSPSPGVSFSFGFGTPAPVHHDYPRPRTSMSPFWW